MRWEFARRVAIPEIARRHQRTRGAILERLIRLGLLRRANGEFPGQGLSDAAAPGGAPPRSRAGKAWTADEDVALLRHFDAGMEAEQIAQRLRRGKHAVVVRLIKLGRSVDTNAK